jgi:hypothetical protein
MKIQSAVAAENPEPKMYEMRHYLMLLVARYFIESDALKTEYWVFGDQFYAEKPVPKGKKVKITVEYEKAE